MGLATDSEPAAADDRTQIVCIGAGPAGLTAAYLLSKSGIPVIVIEADARDVGGLSRTVTYRGFCFDIGGHRFFSKSGEVERLWSELLGPDLLERPRSSSIYYRRRLFAYPLRGTEALLKLGLLESVRCVLSFAWARLFPVREPRSFEDWVSNQFGRRLFRIFFKTYTEKVWGISCRDISADWAAQRIKGLSLGTAIVNALPFRRFSQDPSRVVKTLIERFRYPRRGPGMMWEAAATAIRAQGGTVLMGHRVVGLSRGSDGWTVAARTPNGAVRRIACTHVISSAPIRDLVPALDPPPAEACRHAAGQLRYRDFLIVALILKERGAIKDNWLYIHEPGVAVGRIQNFKAWSPEMVPDPNLCCYGMEYFCSAGDELWRRPDPDLIALARRELADLGLASEDDVIDGRVVRQPDAYPVYDEDYANHVATIRAEIARDYPDLHLVGRNGMHKYNNQDHAMMTAMLTVRNIVAGRALFDPWLVNQDAEYHETITPGPAVSAPESHTPPSRR